MECYLVANSSHDFIGSNERVSGTGSAIVLFLSHEMITDLLISRARHGYKNLDLYPSHNLQRW